MSMLYNSNLSVMGENNSNSRVGLGEHHHSPKRRENQTFLADLTLTGSREKTRVRHEVYASGSDMFGISQTRCKKEKFGGEKEGK